jgi:hypothetical protein
MSDSEIYTAADHALDTWVGVQDYYVHTSGFLEWLEKTHNLKLDYSKARSGTPIDLNRLLDRYFDVPRAELNSALAALPLTKDRDWFK